MSANMPGMLSRDDAATLYAQLQARADRRRARRRGLRRGGAVAAFLALAVTALIVVMFPRGEPAAYAFTQCGTHDPAMNLHPLLSQLAGVPAIALVAAADGQPIRPEQVTAKCAYHGGNTAAIRVTTLIGGRRVAVETWYVAPQLKPIGPAGALGLASEATATAVAGVHDAPAYRAANGAVFVPTPAAGVMAIVVRGAAHQSAPTGIVVGFASRNHTSLVAVYDAVLGSRPTASPTSRAGADGGFRTRTYAVENVDQIVGRLAAQGFSHVAVLPALQPIKLDIVDVPDTRYAKTIYQNDQGRQVTLVQTSKPYLPEIGKVVSVRGTTGKQQGSSVYWDENGWLLAVSTSPDGHPMQLAGELRWRSP